MRWRWRWWTENRRHWYTGLGKGGRNKMNWSLHLSRRLRSRQDSFAIGRKRLVNTIIFTCRSRWRVGRSRPVACSRSGYLRGYISNQAIQGPSCRRILRLLIHFVRRRRVPRDDEALFYVSVDAVPCSPFIEKKQPAHRYYINHMLG